MTQLLISVRDAQECDTAVHCGAHVIDVKEPSRGALGAADTDVVRAISQQLGARAPLSVALGELLQDEPLPGKMVVAIERARYAKIGLAGCAHVSDWSRRWRSLLGKLPANITPVAVAYVDDRIAAAPPPGEVLREARAAGCGGLLLDTYSKQSGTLLDYLSRDELAAFIRAAHDARLFVALGGSLGEQHLSVVARLNADLVAVRGAACAGGRSGSIDGPRVRHLAAKLKELEQSTAAHVSAKG